MAANRTYTISGYIEYLRSDAGFVTPVFISDDLEQYVQVTEKFSQLPTWEVLPKLYKEKVLKVPEYDIRTEGKIIYGFKWQNDLFFGSGDEMETYLTTKFIPNAKDNIRLAKNFIDSWKLLEPKKKSFTEIDIWPECLRLIEENSKILSGVFKENLEFSGFTDNILRLKAKSKEVKNLFEDKFRQQLVDVLRLSMPDFDIKVVFELDIDILPTFYFGDVHYQGSFIMQTSIKEFQDFDNFVVSDFNRNVYENALLFSEHVSGPIAIYGDPGTGKSHILNSIANRISKEQSDKKIALFSIFSTPGKDEQAILSDLELFEQLTENQDIILIDNVSSIKTQDIGFSKFIKLLKKWNHLGKRIVLSSRERIYLDQIAHEESSFKVLPLVHPTEKDKRNIIKFKTNEYDIHLTNYELNKLSENLELRNVGDIQKELVKTCVFNEFKWDSKIRLLYNGMSAINSEWIELSIQKYFIDKFEHRPTSDSLHRKVLADFIHDIFAIPHHGTHVSATMIFRNEYFYSLDQLHHMYFENRDFRQAISDIIFIIMTNQYDY